MCVSGVSPAHNFFALGAHKALTHIYVFFYNHTGRTLEVRGFVQMVVLWSFDVRLIRGLVGIRCESDSPGYDRGRRLMKIHSPILIEILHIF